MHSFFAANSRELREMVKKFAGIRETCAEPCRSIRGGSLGLPLKRLDPILSN